VRFDKSMKSVYYLFQTYLDDYINYNLLIEIDSIIVPQGSPVHMTIDPQNSGILP
jgi:hypothetical protein